MKTNSRFLPLAWAEEIVARPGLATLVVGFTILWLEWLINLWAAHWPAIEPLRWLVPFVPPFFITRTARRINMRRAEYHFVEDAQPIIFLAQIPSPDLSQLLRSTPQVVSRGACELLQMSREELLQSPLLPPARFPQSLREEIFRRLVNRLSQQHPATLPPVRVEALPVKGKRKATYVCSAVMKKQAGGWKLQMTLMPLP